MQEHNENNTISLFIFRSNARGMQYGIGTYIYELTDALLKYPDINIFLISYNSVDIQEFAIKTVSSRFIEVIIPRPIFHFVQNSRSEKKYAGSVVKLLSKLVPKTGQIILQFNYIDDLPIIQLIKEAYDFPCISVVHFAQWQQIFEGNQAKLTNLNLDTPKNNIEFTLSQEREMYRQSDHIVSVTHYMKEFLISEFKIEEKKVSVIKNGLNHISPVQISEGEKAEIRKDLGFSEDEIIILFSGRLDPCKGILLLIEAFERACRKNSSLRLVMLGQGSVQDSQKKMQSAFGKVTFTGFLPKETVMQFYKIADIGISPSVYDHCPYSVIEMIANRIPIIASRINGLDEMLDDNCCLFVNPLITEEGAITLNSDDLAEAILKLVSKKWLRKKLSECAYRIFVNKFKSERMADDMKKLFELITDRTILEKEYEKTKRR